MECDKETKKELPRWAIDVDCISLAYKDIERLLEDGYTWNSDRNIVLEMSRSEIKKLFRKFGL